MYRLVDCDTWNDTWFEALEPQAKLFFLYLITNPRSTSCGAFELSERKMAFETGLPLEQIQSWLREWAPRVMWWPDHSIVWLRNFFRRQGNQNEKTRTNAERLVAELPLEIQAVIGKEYPGLVPSLYTPSIPDAYPMDQTNIGNRNSEEENEKEHESEVEGEFEGKADAVAPRKRKKKPPQPMTENWEPDEKTAAWCRDKGFSPSRLQLEIERFRNHWLGKDEWRPDWQASFRNWMLSPFQHAGGAARASPQNGRVGADPMPMLNLARQLREQGQ